MRKTKLHKFLVISFLAFFSVSCSDGIEIKGYYVGIEENNSPNEHDLLYINDNILIDHFDRLYDSCSYTKKENIYFFECSSFEEFQCRIVANHDTISFYGANSDSLGKRYKKSQSSSYLFDYPYEKLDFQLPQGQGEVKTIGSSYEFKQPLYFYKSEEGELMVNYLNETFQFNEAFYNLESEFPRMNTVSIIADKTLLMTDMKELFDHLKLLGKFKVDYMLEHPVYEEVNFISSLIPPMTNEEIERFSHLNFTPPPAPRMGLEELRNHGVLFDFSNNLKESCQQFKEHYEIKTQADSNTLILYHLAENSTYEDYINFLSTARNTCLDLRDNYLMKKYGKTYRELSKSWNEKAMIKEACKRYPYRLIEIDSAELNEIK